MRQKAAFAGKADSSVDNHDFVAGRASDVRTIKLQALRADLEVVLARYPFGAAFAELILRNGEVPALWLDYCSKVVMEPTPSTYQLVVERGGVQAVQFETADWYLMRQHIVRRLCHIYSQKEVLFAAQEGWSEPRQKARLGKPWLARFALFAAGLGFGILADMAIRIIL